MKNSFVFSHIRNTSEPLWSKQSATVQLSLCLIIGSSKRFCAPVKLSNPSMYMLTPAKKSFSSAAFAASTRLSCLSSYIFPSILSYRPYIAAISLSLSLNKPVPSLSAAAESVSQDMPEFLSIFTAERHNAAKPILPDTPE